jgi:hypothetical protein
VYSSASGKYLITSTNSSCSGYVGCITSPSSVGTILLRVETKNNNTDAAYVQSYIANATLNAINPRTPSLPALTLADFEGLSNISAVSILQLAARFQTRAPPEAASFKTAVPPIFALAGISNGTYTQPSSANLTQAAALVKSSTTSFEEAPCSYTELGNGWSVLSSSIIGTFDSGRAIIARTLTATALYLANNASETLYPTLGSTQLNLTDSEAYLFTFSGKPPISDAGFWSVTMYDDDGYLVNNTLNTYAVGDRSNITYSDGTLVYDNSTENGTFQVLIQDANVIPPTNWTAKYV